MRCCITCGWWKRTSLISKKICQHVWVEKNKKTKQNGATQKEASEHRRNWSKLINYCSFLQYVCRSSICFCVFSPTAWRFQTHCNSCIKSATPPPALTHNQMWFISVCPDRFVFDTRQLRPVVVFIAIFKFKHYFSFSTEKKEKNKTHPNGKGQE